MGGGGTRPKLYRTPSMMVLFRLLALTEPLAMDALVRTEVALLVNLFSAVPKNRYSRVTARPGTSSIGKAAPAIAWYAKLVCVLSRVSCAGPTRGLFEEKGMRSLLKFVQATPMPPPRYGTTQGAAAMLKSYRALTINPIVCCVPFWLFTDRLINAPARLKPAT